MVRYLRLISIAVGLLLLVPSTSEGSKLYGGEMLRCGIPEAKADDPWSREASNGQLIGYDVETCRALGRALNLDAASIALVQVSDDDRMRALLVDETIDVLVARWVLSIPLGARAIFSASIPYAWRRIKTVSGEEQDYWYSILVFPGEIQLLHMINEFIADQYRSGALADRYIKNFGLPLPAGALALPGLNGY